MGPHSPTAVKPKKPESTFSYTALMTFHAAAWPGVDLRKPLPSATVEGHGLVRHCKNRKRAPLLTQGS
jgi:hypothetical protein